MFDYKQHFFSVVISWPPSKDHEWACVVVLLGDKHMFSFETYNTHIKLYEFPIAAVTKYHKCSGLKKHKFIFTSVGQKSNRVSRDWNQEVDRDALLSGGSRRESAALSFLLSSDSLHSLVYKDPTAPSKPAIVVQVLVLLSLACFHCHTVSDNSQENVSAFRDSYD